MAVLHKLFVLAVLVSTTASLDIITLPPGLQPEGICQGWGPNVYVTGPSGRIVKINTQTREIVQVADLSGELALGATLALKLSKESKLLFVTGAFTGKLWVFKMRPSDGLVESGPVSVLLNASPFTLINDVALHTRCSQETTANCKTTAYATDSAVPIVYAVKGCPENCQVTKYTDPEFAPVFFPPLGAALGTNGIAAHPLPANTLLVAHPVNGKILKVQLSGGQAMVTPVKITNTDGAIVSVQVDGMYMSTPRVMYGALITIHQVAKFTFNDDYTEAVMEVVAEGLESPTNIAPSGGKLWVVNAFFFSQDPTRACPPFQLCPDKVAELVALDRNP